ncbi:MAG: hypothetical protein LBU32_11150 [Clostridiales bacterium]|jgi:hypothetical protein|nr:hypothetical protein [Clostridiales bacterium]
MGVLKDSIGFLGVGLCGGNFASRFAEKGMRCLCINTSASDLNAIESGSIKKHVVGGHGSAHNRAKSKQLINEDFPRISELLEDSFAGCGIIAIIFSSGGGVGSGSSPMLLDYMSSTFPEKIICGITVLPANSESIKVRENALECFKEIESIKGMGALFVLDNQMAYNRLWLNASFCDLFCEMLEMPCAGSSSKKTSDGILKEMLAAPGCAVMAKTPKSMSSTGSIINSLKHSSYSPFSPGRAKYLALSMSTDIDCEKVKEIFGDPSETFIGISGKSTILFATGLNIPSTRLQNLREVLEADAEERMRSLSSRVLVDSPDLNPGSNKIYKPVKLTREELFAKYIHK